MRTTYTNLPLEKPGPNANTTFKYFDQYYEKPIELDGNVLSSAKGFFESKGFGDDSAELISTVILSQAKANNINPSTIIDTMKGYDNSLISIIVSEILNYYRVRTSSLGLTLDVLPADEVQRNIIA